MIDLIICLLAIPIILFLKRVYNNKINLREVKRVLSTYNMISPDSYEHLGAIEYVSYGFMKFYDPTYFDSISYNFKLFSKYRITITSNSQLYTENLEFDVPRFSIIHFQINKLFKRFSSINAVPKSKTSHSYINVLYYTSLFVRENIQNQQTNQNQVSTPPTQNYEPQSIDEKLVI